MGKATVWSGVGGEGLDVQDERDILLADDPGGFPDAIVMLLRNEDVLRRYEVATAATARKHGAEV